MKKITLLLLGILLSSNIIISQTSVWSAVGDDFTGFTLVDRDGDGFGWGTHTDFFGEAMDGSYGFTNGTVFGSNGYDYVNDVLLTADDLLYTPDNIAIPAGATGTVFSMEYSVAESFAPDHVFYIYAYETGTTVDFDAPGSTLIATITTTDADAETKQDFSVDIPASLVGKTIGLIFRNTSVTTGDGGSIFYMGNLNVSYATLSIENNNLEINKILPNPVKNIVKIDTKYVIESATIFNQLGQQVMVINNNITKNTFDLSSLNSGLYFMNLKSENLETVIKVVKE